MATKLEQKQQELAAKQKKLHDVFTAAGEDMDFTKAEVLTLTGKPDSKGAVEWVQAENKALEALGKEVDELKSLAGIAGDIQQRLSRVHNAPPLPGADPEPQLTKGLGELIMAVPEIKGHRRGQGPIGAELQGFSLKEVKTTFTTSAGWAPESMRIPGLVIPYATRPVQVLDIIPTGPTSQAVVKYMEETTFTPASAERNEEAAYAAATFALTERSSTVRSIGSSVPVTDEQLEDVAGVQTYLNNRLVFGARQRLDSEVLVGDGVAPNLTGILDNGNATLQTQAKGTDPVPDAVYKAMTKVRVTGRAFPGAFVVHPNDWQDVRLLRTADGIYIWGSPAEAGPERIWGIQVVQSDALSEGTGLVGDFNFCQLYERSGMDVQIGYDGNDFTYGRRTIRCGFRVALAIYRGAAFCSVTSI